LFDAFFFYPECPETRGTLSPLLLNFAVEYAIRKVVKIRRTVIE
jgi:hypothetical protein